MMLGKFKKNVYWQVETTQQFLHYIPILKWYDKKYVSFIVFWKTRTVNHGQDKLLIYYDVTRETITNLNE